MWKWEEKIRKQAEKIVEMGRKMWKRAEQSEETGSQNVESDLKQCVYRPKISGNQQKKQRKRT